MSDAFDYYPDTDTLIVRLRRAPATIGQFHGGPFTVITGDMGDLVEIEIRHASHFLARALSEGVPDRRDGDEALSSN
jgi:hypothetical protein